jgi:hypothetical protein
MASVLYGSKNKLYNKSHRKLFIFTLKGDENFDPTVKGFFYPLLTLRDNKLKHVSRETFSTKSNMSGVGILPANQGTLTEGESLVQITSLY